MRSLLGSRLSALACAALAVSFVTAIPASAETRDKAFFDSVVGTWKGPGKVVAGKYKGTRFECDLTGDPLKKGETGVAMGGQCRVGVFTQDMNAVIARTAEGYTGRFLDGAKGKGLDVISGDIGENKVVVAINRKQLYGAMVASMHGPNTMNVTISVKVDDRYVPVIGMTLQRDLDNRAVGSIQ